MTFEELNIGDVYQVERHELRPLRVISAVSARLRPAVGPEYYMKTLVHGDESECGGDEGARTLCFISNKIFNWPDKDREVVFISTMADYCQGNSGAETFNS